jgi:ATP/maltotriose-dependent transcriptional regulator MalT
VHNIGVFSIKGFVSAPVLSALLNKIANVHPRFLRVHDDYHLIDGEQPKEILTFLLDHLLVEENQ